MRVTAWFRRTRLDRDLDRELQFHLAQHTRDLIAGGLSPSAAERQARLELGGLDQVRERVRESRSGAWLDRLRCDTRDAVRGLTRTPGVALTAVALIGLVIGGNTTVFSMVHGILTKPARGVESKRLVTLQSNVNGVPEPGLSYADFQELAATSTTVRSLLGSDFVRFTLTVPNGSYAVQGAAVTHNYFETLGVRLIRGRSFNTGESALDASGLVAILGYRVWQEQLGAGEDVIGRAIVLNGYPATVVGVAAPGFQGTWLTEMAQVWVPFLAYTRLTGREKTLADPQNSRLMAIGRLSPGASLAAARTEFSGLSKRLDSLLPEANRSKHVAPVAYSVTAGGNSLVSTRGSAFLAIFSVITLITVIVVCANVANLMLARAVIRQRETAVRRALGASRAGIIRTLTIEALLISLTACVAACVFAFWTSRVLVTLFPATAQGSAMPLDFTPDWKVLAYAMALALVATVVFTLPPASRAWRQNLLPSLKTGEKGVVQGRSRLTSTLVVLQLALTVVLLTGAGLAYRSTSITIGRSLGFDKDRVLLTTIRMAGVSNAPETNRVLIERIRQRMAAVPGVLAVSYAQFVPSMPDRTWLSASARRNATESGVRAWMNIVGPDFLRVLGLAPVAGRTIGADDMGTPRPVAVIDQALADVLWPSESAVGRTLHLGSNYQPAQVVGVVPDALFSGYISEPHPHYVFLSHGGEPAGPGELTFYVKYAVALDIVAPAIARALRSALFGITPTDATTYSWVFAVLAATSLLASYLPTRRVTAVDPMQVLREE